MSLRLEAGHRTIRGVTLIAVALLVGTLSLLPGCAAAPDYDPPAVYGGADPDHGYSGLDYWDGWHDWRHHDHGFHHEH